MADYEAPLRTQATNVEAIDEGLRSHMISVYQYMMLGVAVTGLTAYFTAGMPAIYNLVHGPLAIVFLLAPVAIVWLVFGNIQRMSAASAQAWFWFYSAMIGAWLSAIFHRYADADIVRVFFITSISFGSLSLYGYTTKRDLSAWGSFLFMGLVGILLALVVNYFMQSSALDFAVSVVGVLVFAGLTAYDTQRAKEIYFAGDDSETAGKKAIIAALELYLDFINMFLFLLRLVGSSRD